MNGIEKSVVDQGYAFSKGNTRAESTRVTGKISGENHPFIQHFKFLLPFVEEGIVPRLTIPAPAQFFKELQRPSNAENTKSFYPDEKELIHDIASAYQTFIQELYAAGCRSLQLDDCTWGMLTDPKIAAINANASNSGDSGCQCGAHGVDHGADISEIKEKLLTVNNKALEHLPEDLILTTHVCRGNYRSTWMASGT